LKRASARQNPDSATSEHYIQGDARSDKLGAQVLRPIEENLIKLWAPQLETSPWMPIRFAERNEFAGAQLLNPNASVTNKIGVPYALRNA
jgi:hypothetical protein